MVVIVNDWRNGSTVGQYGINLIASHFVVLVGVVLRCLVWNFECTSHNILDMDASHHRHVVVMVKNG